MFLRKACCVCLGQNSWNQLNFIQVEALPLLTCWTSLCLGCPTLKQDLTCLVVDLRKPMKQCMQSIWHSVKHHFPSLFLPYNLPHLLFPLQKPRTSDIPESPTVWHLIQNVPSSRGMSPALIWNTGLHKPLLPKVHSPLGSHSLRVHLDLALTKGLEAWHLDCFLSFHHKVVRFPRVL